MPPEDAEEKRIVFRVDAEEWKLLDDKRHNERESWQSLGLKLYRQWLSGATAPLTPSQAPPSPKRGDSVTKRTEIESVEATGISDPEFVSCVQRLATIWRAGDARLRDWIAGNLRVFAGTAERGTQYGSGVEDAPPEPPAGRHDSTAGFDEAIAHADREEAEAQEDIEAIKRDRKPTPERKVGNLGRPRKRRRDPGGG